ncbi:hypothetical protein Tco_1385552 [Tanacetum coccineum]
MDKTSPSPPLPPPSHVSLPSWQSHTFQDAIQRLLLFKFPREKQRSGSLLRPLCHRTAESYRPVWKGSLRENARMGDGADKGVDSLGWGYAGTSVYCHSSLLVVPSVRAQP